ncbi:MAG TPA: alternative ribosome rescue aminoacyl-tRNA hydrolase ArfB [Acidimicrobiales bacterium]|nr:alternative ribosome rescue aminoacyl-tRNA hydrolase ArfB [Acidimicrobiales bacterium]
MLRVSPSCSIPDDELVWRFSASGGPGGQHVNTANTRVELVFDIANSPSLGPRQRARLLEKLGASVRVVASHERSQLRNREEARRRLAERLSSALQVDRPRVKTRATKSSVERRLESKRRTAQIKARRQGRYDD